jgi:hypothetical protein
MALRKRAPWLRSYCAEIYPYLTCWQIACDRLERFDIRELLAIAGAIAGAIAVGTECKWCKRTAKILAAIVRHNTRLPNG